MGRYYRCEDGTILDIEDILYGELTDHPEFFFRSDCSCLVPRLDYDKISDILMGMSKCGWESLGVCGDDTGVSSFGGVLGSG